jgi:hypothetical protein
MAIIKGSEIRKADHPIDNIFLDRWSPRAMSGEEIPETEIMSCMQDGIRNSGLSSST